MEFIETLNLYPCSGGVSLDVAKTHVLGLVSLHQPPIMFYSFGCGSLGQHNEETRNINSWAAERRKTDKGQNAKKTSFQTLLSSQSTSTNIANIASNYIQKCSLGNLVKSTGLLLGTHEGLKNREDLQEFK